MHQRLPIGPGRDDRRDHAIDRVQMVPIAPLEAAPLTGMKGGKPGVLALERHALTRAVRDGRHVQVQDWHDP